MKVELTAVQAKFEIADYKDGEAFRNKIFDLMHRVQGAGSREAEHALVAFPESIGLGLMIIAGNYDKVKDCKTLTAAAIRVLTSRFSEVAKTAWKYKAFGLRAYFLARALDVYEIYHETFLSAAREFGVYLCAGSAYLPRIETESAKGTFVQATKIYNVSYVYNPSGRLIGRIPKVHLTPPAETGNGFSKGRVSDLVPIHTAFGPVGVLICYDGFHEALVGRYDSMGVKVLIKPSRNGDKWEQPWWADKSVTQAHSWLRDGIRHMVQGRENLKYGINPMMVGDMFDMHDEGRSAILADASIAPEIVEGFPGILAIAATHTEEEIVSRLVDI